LIIGELILSGIVTFPPPDIRVQFPVPYWIGAALKLVESTHISWSGPASAVNTIGFALMAAKGNVTSHPSESINLHVGL
jgi:hypothetical protein